MYLRFPALLLLAAWCVVRLEAKDAPTVPVVPGVVFEQVTSFAQPPHYPLSRLLYVPADGNYYGTAPDGGARSAGAIFRLAPDGTSTTLVSFTGSGGSAKGAAPDSGLVLGADGALYGTTTAGGSYGFGTIFKVTTAGVFATLVEFTDTFGSAKGSVPGELVLAADGNFYGTTQFGGASDAGTIFRMTPAGVLTTLVEFTGAIGARLGATPVGALVASGTTLYGVTQAGGSAGTTDLGTVFKVTTSGVFTTLVQFNGTNGSAPSAGLCLHSDGALYGTTEFGGTGGGTGDFGTLFKYNPGTSTFSIVKHFASTDGAQPAGALLSGADGLLYGTTNSGGTHGLGTVFKITTSGSHTAWSFTGKTGAMLGSTPRAGLIATPGGAFAGTTSAGGVGGFGTCFTITSVGAFTNWLNFSSAAGWSPGGGPVFDDAGDMLVPLSEGGAAGFGTLRRVQVGGGTSTQAAFGSPLGEVPAGGLLRVGADFFGVTSAGGTNSRGTFFKHTPGTGTNTVASCSSSSSSGAPQGPPTLGPDGFFYVAARGSGSGKGSIIRFGADGSRNTLVSFAGKTSAPRGTRPLGPLALGEDGNFYGVTEQGGVNDKGTVFKMTPAGTLTTLVEFSSSGSEPHTPLGALVAGPDGNFYGTTSGGGASGYGTIYRLAPGGTLTVLASFTDSSGAVPGSEATGSLLAALDGTLYGTTAQGGGDGKGVAFRLSPSGAFSLLYEFGSSSSGDSPEGALAFGPDGFLYGTTPRGGSAGGGNVFRLKKLGPHAGTDAPTFAPGIVGFHGRVQTGGEATNVSFEYGPTPALGLATAPASAEAGGSPASFSAEIADLAPGSTIYYRARAENPSGTSTGLVRNLVVPEPLAAWKLATFGNTDPADLDDCDADGSLNLTEYALVTCATSADSAGLPTPVVKTYAEGPRLSLTVQRDPARSDVTIEVQAAGNVSGPWEAVATSTLGAPFSGAGYVSGESATPGVKTVEIRDVVNLGSVPARYMRIQVSH